MPLHNPDQGDFESKARELEGIARLMGMRWSMGISGTDEFVHEQQVFIDSLKRDIITNCMSYRYGIDEINRRIEELKKQNNLLISQEVEMYAIIEKKKEEKLNTLVLAEVGFLSGLAQVVGGGLVCARTRGSACAKYGIPNIIQGANNVYENGYYVIFMKNTTGTLRDAYHYVAHKLGVSNDTADLVYGAVDLGLTTGNYTKLVMLSREKSWSLFRHIRSDFIRGWQEAGKLTMGMDVIGSIANLYQMYKIETKPTIKPVTEQGKK